MISNPKDPSTEKKINTFRCTLAPWLAVDDSIAALAFYQKAFGATEIYRLDTLDAVLANLSIEGAEFWMSDEAPQEGSYSPKTLGGGSVRMILTVQDPDAVLDLAIAAGATLVYPVEESHGWRIGCVEDPFGHRWEIGHPLTH